MKKSVKKAATVIMAAVLCAGLLSGCGSEGKAQDNDQNAQEEEKKDTQEDGQSAQDAEALSGSITMAGSTSMEKFCTALNEAFMAAHPDVTVNAEYIGSSAGIEEVMKGGVDIGNSSRALKDSEKEAGAVENIVAIDGIAVVTDPGNTVDNLSKEDLKGIYTGKVTNWSELGGENIPIVVVGREAGSGTRGAFEELLEITDQCVYANELDSTGAVMAKAASTKGAIGYVSLDVLDDTVKAMKLENVEATAENIKSGNYFLSRPFVMATAGEIAEQKEAVQEMFSYLASDEGKKLIESVGLIAAAE